MVTLVIQVVEACGCSYVLTFKSKEDNVCLLDAPLRGKRRGGLHVAATHVIRCEAKEDDVTSVAKPGQEQAGQH